MLSFQLFSRFLDRCAAAGDNVSLWALGERFLTYPGAVCAQLALACFERADAVLSRCFGYVPEAQQHEAQAVCRVHLARSVSVLDRVMWTGRDDLKGWRVCREGTSGPLYVQQRVTWLQIPRWAAVEPVEAPDLVQSLFWHMVWRG